MYQEKKAEENLLALNTALTHQYDLKITLKSAEKDWLQIPEQNWQHEDQQNEYINKTKMGRKTTLWTF